MIFVVLGYNTGYMSLFTIVLHAHMKKPSLFLMLSFLFLFFFDQIRPTFAFKLKIYYAPPFFVICNMIYTS